MILEWGIHIIIYVLNSKNVQWCFLGSSVKNPPAMQDTGIPSLGWEDPQEKEMATHSSILAW